MTLRIRKLLRLSVDSDTGWTDMKLLRNREVFSVLMIMLIISGAAILYTHSLDRKYCLLTLVLCSVFIVLYLVSTALRYRKLSSLTSEINSILHDESRMLINDFNEGELALLRAEIRKMTVRLREQSQLLKEDKIRLADFLADVSHQIRTPLTSLNLLVSFLEKPDLSPERRREIAHELSGLLRRIDWLITVLLKISRLDAGVVKFRSETIDMNEFISKASAPLQIPIEIHGQNLIIDADGSITADESWTCEAVGNILKNCMEHTPEGGSITVKATENSLYSEIIISDSGSGISEDDLPHIFERFYKGKDSDDSSFGIGLALARMIVTEQNGTIKAENSAEGGARFSMRFYKGTV